jgi:hypothetical protein
MGIAIYTLCTVTSLLSAWLLLGGYRRNGRPLLFWSGVCFLLLAVSNGLNLIDRMTPPNLNLIPARLATALVAVLIILCALIWGGE